RDHADQSIPRVAYRLKITVIVSAYEVYERDSDADPDRWLQLIFKDHKSTAKVSRRAAAKRG
ncbi:MAG TPA: hypothetical protein VKG02_17860, partial [Blastocatellia bacterium]|nr:hypothetical protein [Blastocatellia bacterium]